MSMFKKQIVIIGSSKATKELENIAYKTGSLIAKHGYVVVCGGKAGIMEAVCKGAKYKGGMTIGIIPENEAIFGNKYLDIVIPTGINYLRNYIVQNSGNVIIMIGGGYGTLSELAYALLANKKIIALKSKWAKIDKKIIVAKDPEEAVKKAIS